MEIMLLEAELEMEMGAESCGRGDSLTSRQSAPIFESDYEDETLNLDSITILSKLERIFKNEY